MAILNTMSVHQMRAIAGCVRSPVSTPRKSEAVEPYTIVIIKSLIAGVLYRPMRQYFHIQNVLVEWMCSRYKWGRLEFPRRALWQEGHDTQPHHNATSSEALLEALKPYAYYFGVMVELFRGLPPFCAHLSLRAH
jgi:hypothetical protein